MDAAQELANSIVRTSYQDLPADVVEITKKHVLDQLGVTIGGSAADVSRILRAQVSDWSGKPESTVLVFGDRVPAPHAAQVNATMGRVLDLYDTDDRSGNHAGYNVIPPALAIAEFKGKVSGKEFIAAVALGVDLNYRLQLTPQYEPGRATPGVHRLFGYFAATAAAGKLLGLDGEHLAYAFGIAFHGASASNQAVVEAAPVTHIDMTATTGVWAALLAARGVKGPQKSMEGREGLFPSIYGGCYERSNLLSEHGKRFEGAKACFKPYPTCRATHPAIDATLELVTKHDLRPEDISEVVVCYPNPRRSLVLEPLEAKRHPRTAFEAEISMPYCVAVAIARRQVTLAEFADEVVHDPVVLGLAARVSYREEKSLAKRGIPAEIVEITTTGGRKLSLRVDNALGDPAKPMSFEAVADKFRKCAGYAAQKLPAENLEQVIEVVRRLEQVEDVSSLIPLLCTRTSPRLG